MLFIYGALSLGGIETFFVRMAKQRYIDGLSTTILLLSEYEKNDNNLLSEMKKYANVYFYNDVFYGSNILVKSIPLILPIKKSKLITILENVEHIHVSDGEFALLGYRFSSLINSNIPISVGFYNPVKFSWGGTNVGYYEKVNRRFVLNYLPKELLSLYSKGLLDIYNQLPGVNLNGANVFRLGVVDSKNIKINGILSKPILICSVGRLVKFKTYNLYMLNVIKSLINRGYNIEYHIFGEGDYKSVILNQIIELGLENNVKLRGSLDYSKFDEVISKFNLFIGSGTSIIQASSLGVCSIVGIEQVKKPISYGYFSNVYMHSYNINGLNLPYYDVEDLILNFIHLNKYDREKLITSHLDSVEYFTNKNCSDCFESLKDNQMPVNKFHYNVLWHQLTKLIDIALIKLRKNHSRNNRK